MGETSGSGALQGVCSGRDGGPLRLPGQKEAGVRGSPGSPQQRTVRTGSAGAVRRTDGEWGLDSRGTTDQP